jgi:hypothetical protein
MRAARARVTIATECCAINPGVVNRESILRRVHQPTERAREVGGVERAFALYVHIVYTPAGARSARARARARVPARAADRRVRRVHRRNIHARRLSSPRRCNETCALQLVRSWQQSGSWACCCSCSCSCCCCCCCCSSRPTLSLSSAVSRHLLRGARAALVLPEVRTFTLLRKHRSGLSLLVMCP